MARRDLVVVGASAGGVEALVQLLRGLPPDLSAAVLVVLHMPPGAHSALPAILGRVCNLPVAQAADGTRLEPGTVTVALPDQHLIVVDGHVALSRGPRENGHRPAVDVLFRSAARVAGRRVVAIVLSGVLDDGTAGMIAVRARGGVGLVQDPADAMYPSMPRSAAAIGGAEHVAPAATMGAILADLLAEDIGAVDEPKPSDLMDTETAMANLDLDALTDDDRPGSPSGFGCPSCHGALFAIDEGGMERFRCRVGHAWTPEALAAEQGQAIEGALWMALRALEERAALSRRMGQRAQQRGHLLSAQGFGSRHDEAQAAAAVLRRLLQDGRLNGEPIGGDVAEA